MKLIKIIINKIKQICEKIILKYKVYKCIKEANYSTSDFTKKEIQALERWLKKYPDIQLMHTNENGVVVITDKAEWDDWD